MADERRWFHGTSGTYSFKPGDLLTPGSTPRGMSHVYYTSHLPSAAGYATWGHPLGEHGLQDLDADARPGHVYEVVPETSNGKRIGRHAEDPASGLSGNAEAYRTKGRLRVLHEVDRETGEPIEHPDVMEHFGAAEEPGWTYDNSIMGQTSARSPEGKDYTFYGRGTGIKGVRHHEDVPVPMYHGSNHEFAPGDLIETGHPGNFVSRMKHVYMTEQAEGEDGGYKGARGYGRHVYQVEPTGWYGHRTDARGGEWATEHPLRVVGEVPNPREHVASLANPLTGHDEWFHGTQAPESEFHRGFHDPAATDPEGIEMPESEPTGTWSRILGNHFAAAHDVANAFAGGEHSSSHNDWTHDGQPAVVHARLQLSNPKHYDSEFDLDSDAYEHAWGSGDHPSNYLEGDREEDEEMWPSAVHLHDKYGDGEIPKSVSSGVSGIWGIRSSHPDRSVWLNSHPNRYVIAENFKQHLMSQGHDGIIYGNEIERSGEDHPYANTAAIAFHPHQIEITHHQHDLPERLAVVQHFAGANPPCYYCHEPLNDEDIQDGQSAHEECSDMRWCDACNEEHEDPQEAEDHNSTYTDWGGHVFDNGIHRGVTVRLPDDVHAIVHDGSRPSAERAAALASYLHANPIDEDSSHGRAAGYGVHWTDHLPTAQAWGSGEGSMFGIADDERHDPRWTHVVMHAAAPEDDDFETDPKELSRRNMLGYDSSRSEREIPLTATAPVHLNALSWKPAGSPADGWQRHELPSEHHAATASLLEHFEDGTPRYHPEAVCPTCRGRNWHPAQLSDDLPNHLHELPAPAECNNCHDIFDASKSGRQVAEEREQEHRDWEETTRNRTYNGEPLFHGTRSELHPGELLTPGEAERHPAHPDEESLGYVHATPSGEEAYGWGERASGFETHDRMSELGRTQPIRPGHNQGDAYRPRVYHVEPTGPVESDPNGEGSSFRTAHPLRVVKEVHALQCSDCPDTGRNEEHWPDHPHHAYLQQIEDEEHEDDNDDWGEHDASLDDEDEGDHDGDGYTTCDQGHEHWGLNGAAGLLIRHHGDDGQTRYLLQHRSPHVQHGNTWSTPGGAMGSSETPEHAALREATEEMGVLPGNLTHHHTHTDDHGGWAYHTVVMDSPRQFAPRGHGEDDWESSGAQWLTPREIGSLPLHPGFQSSWDRVQHSGALVAVTAADVPSFTHNYQTYGPEGGYIDQQREVTGPFYHGGRSRRLGEGDQLTPGRKTNGWGDEGSKSQYVHFTTNLNGAAEYARQAGGHVYEVEPTGDDVQMGYSGDEWKSKAPLRVRRVVPPAEIEQHAHTGKLVVAANVADRAPARVIAPALPAGTTARNTLGDWMPQNAAETHDMLDGFPVLFTAIYDGLMGVVARLEDSPVSDEITGIVRTMATACQTAAEDATEIAARPLDGPEGMWEGSLAGKA